MKKALGIIILFLLASCGGSDGGGDGVANLVSPKEIDSLWTLQTDDSVELDLRSLTLETAYVLYANIILEADFITTLSNASLDVTGLVAGTSYTCEYAFIVYSDGTYYMNNINVADIATNNVCYQYDNYCDGGSTCNATTAHTWNITNNILTVNPFGDSIKGGEYDSWTYE